MTTNVPALVPVALTGTQAKRLIWLASRAARGATLPQHRDEFLEIADVLSQASKDAFQIEQGQVVA